MSELKEKSALEAFFGSDEKIKSSTQVMCEERATDVDGIVTKTEDGNYTLTTTLGKLVRYTYVEESAYNLNKQCALVAISQPLNDHHYEIRIEFVVKSMLNYKMREKQKEIENEIGNDGDMNNEVKVIAMDIVDLMQSDYTVWTTVDKDAEIVDLWQWWHIANQHHVIKIKDSLPF